MADLRQLVTSLGHADVATYIQSGNVVFTPSSPADPAELARSLRSAISESLGLDPPVVVVSRDELASVIASNPYPDEPKPQYVHCVFLATEPDGSARSKVDEIVSATTGGTRDELTVLGRTVYLHTPDGFGNSELSKALLAKRNSPLAGATARNWATVTKLLAMCDGPS